MVVADEGAVGMAEVDTVALEDGVAAVGVEAGVVEEEEERNGVVRGTRRVVDIRADG
jgi:hypothetical protein